MATTIGPQAGRWMGRGWGVAAAVVLALVAAGCGGSGTDDEGGSAGAGGTGGAGGSGGTGGTGGGEVDLEQLCLGTCQPLAACGFLPTEAVQECVDYCVANTLDQEQLVGCVACLEAATCDVILGGCSDACSPEMYDATVTFEGEGTGVVGELVVSAIDVITGSVWQQSSTLVKGGETARIELQQVLAEGRPFRLDAFLDTDLDGSCGDADRTWRIDVEAPTGAAELVLEPDAAAAPEACASFGDWARDAVVLGSGFGDHEGRAVVFVLRADWNGNELAAQMEGLVADGSFAAVFDGQLYSDMTDYRIGWFIDVDGDGRCSTAADLGGSSSLEAPFTAHERIELTADAAGAPDCGLFFGVGQDLTVVGSGFGGYEGERMAIVLVEAETGATASFGDAVVADGGFTLPLERSLAEGVAYRLSLWVDVDGDGTCGGGDAMWWHDVSASSSAATAEVSYRATFDADACSAQPHVSGF
ncbi:hypothetical protein [Vulgatibacter sp.]|uniref:hypothetical protein n=1 Tax=Vulgatibacter sp. TaxID=1971226 RepID=UPI0035650A2A